MDRPVTSKSRGICKYYSTPRGCFAADNCKFLHGPDEKLTPHDKAKVCKYYVRGHCTRGSQCWFRHVLPKVAPDDERVRFSAETCCICLEKPSTYGLLTDCSHVFCLECIRQWRAPAGKSPDVISSGMIKCCPLCRTPSRFVTPSEHFFPNDSPRKTETIEAYKASMAKVPCKYFDEMLRLGKPCCPFGIDCFYKHTNTDGTAHVFHHGAKHSMNIYRRLRLRGAFPPARFDYDDPIDFLQHIFENPITNLHATLDVIRASLPALMERFSASNGPGLHDTSEDDEIMDDLLDALDLPRDDLITRNETPNPLPGTAGEDNQRSPPMEAFLGRAPSPERTPLLLEHRPASQTAATHSSPESQSVSSRFSTMMNNHNRQSFIIDISDDDEDEEEEESVQQGFNISPNSSVEPSNSPLLATTSITQSSAQQLSTQSARGLQSDISPDQPQCEHDVDPPFVTDGRGRVVWSSTRNTSGRGAATDGRALRNSRTGSRIPSLVSNARGNAWGGQDAQGIDEKVGGGEENNDMD